MVPIGTHLAKKKISMGRLITSFCIRSTNLSMDGKKCLHRTINSYYHPFFGKMKFGSRLPDIGPEYFDQVFSSTIYKKKEYSKTFPKTNWKNINFMPDRRARFPLPNFGPYFTFWADLSFVRPRRIYCCFRTFSFDLEISFG